jgi:hypothetical protein
LTSLKKGTKKEFDKKTKGSLKATSTVAPIIGAGVVSDSPSISPSSSPALSLAKSGKKIANKKQGLFHVVPTPVNLSTTSLKKMQKRNNTRH